jgi:hypothetical protein
MGKYAHYIASCSKFVDPENAPVRIKNKRHVKTVELDTYVSQAFFNVVMDTFSPTTLDMLMVENVLIFPTLEWRHCIYL